MHTISICRKPDVINLISYINIFLFSCQIDKILKLEYIALISIFMDINLIQNLNRAIEQSNRILLLLPYDYSGDTVSGAMAFYNYLKSDKKDKIVDLILPQKPKKIYSFLPKIELASLETSIKKNFVISINTEKKKVKAINYSENLDSLDLVINCDSGVIDPGEVTWGYDEIYDLIITFNCIDESSFGDIYKENKIFFDKTFTINVSNKRSSANFVDVDIADLEHKSISETIYTIFSYNNVFISTDIANCLMSGLVFATRGFTSHDITPRILDIASKLMDLGAERERIISKIYQTKSIELLKSWGSILSGLKYDPQYKIAWSELSSFKGDTRELEIEDLIDELISKASQAEIIVLFELVDKGSIKAHVYSNFKYNSFDLIKDIPNLSNITGNSDILKFEINEIISDAREKILDAIRKRVDQK